MEEKAVIYIGQEIPIYIVPDDTETSDQDKSSWVKTHWVFRVVGIHRTLSENEDGEVTVNDVVDIEWPNKHIDSNIPINNMCSDFARIPRSLVPHFTERNDIDPKAKSNIEKLEQLLKMLQFLSEHAQTQVDSDEEEPKQQITELEEEPEHTYTQQITKVEEQPEQTYTEEQITQWCQPPSKGGLRIMELRDKAREMGVNPQKLKKPELQKAMLEKII